jgi:hypothetical protein
MRRPGPRDGERGAAVLLFVALVVAAAIAATASMMIGRPQFAVQQGTGTGFDLTALRKAVEAHAWVVGGGTTVACPADNNGDEDCTGATEGPVPWRTIGVTQRQARDAWNQPIQIVARPVSLDSNRGGGLQTGCDFVLISGGDDLAIDADLTAPTTIDVKDPVAGSDLDLDIAVCGELGGVVPSNSLLDPNKFTTTADTVNHIKPRFKTPPHADWAASDKVMSFGGSSDDPDTYDLTASNVTKAACAWYDDAFNFTDETLRGFIRFQFLPGEPLSTQTMGTGQGFALMVIPGDRTVSATSCGTAASDNAFGFKGVARPKFALEFDIYKDNYENADDISGGRNNPNPEGNHVALLNPLTADYISHGGSGNPGCQTVPVGENAPAMNGEKGACTYPPANINDRPARHAVRPANWLEDDPYLDTALSQNAAQPYVVRFEFKRLCNADCSTCGVAGGTKVHAKAWIACNAEVLAGNPGACPALPEGFDDVTESYADTTDYMVNYCMPDRSLSYPESFDTVKIGIGFSTRNSAVALLLHRFEAKSD